MLQYFGVDALPSSTVVLQHVVNLSAEVNRQPLEWRLHHARLLQGLLAKSLSVLQYKLERYQHGQRFGAVCINNMLKRAVSQPAPPRTARIACDASPVFCNGHNLF